MMTQVRRWWPGRRLVLVGDGGCAAVSLARAWVKSQVGLGARRRWDAALDHPPGPQPPGKRGRTPSTGKRQRRVQDWAERSDTPWEDVEVDWDGGQRQQLWVFSHTALWDTPGVPPVEMRLVIVCDPAGQRRMEAFCCPDLQAPPGQILAWVIMRWSVEVTVEEARVHVGFETQRQWSDQAIARTTPVVWALCSLVTVLALQVSQGGPLPVQAAAWDQKAAPTVGAWLAWVRRHVWRARYAVNAAAEAACVPFPREAFDLLSKDLSLAA
jgi:hypothetical protein